MNLLKHYKIYYANLLINIMNGFVILRLYTKLINHVLYKFEPFHRLGFLTRRYLNQFRTECTDACVQNRYEQEMPEIKALVLKKQNVASRTPIGISNCAVRATLVERPIFF